MIFQSDCNDGWERIDCDFDKSSELSNIDVAELLTIIDSFLDSMIGSIFFQWNSLEIKYVKLKFIKICVLLIVHSFCLYYCIS